MFSTRFNRWIVAAFAVTALAMPCSLAAQTPDHPADNSAQFPSNRDLKSLTMSGSYLADIVSDFKSRWEGNCAELSAG